MQKCAHERRVSLNFRRNFPKNIYIIKKCFVSLIHVEYFFSNDGFTWSMYIRFSSYVQQTASGTVPLFRSVVYTDQAVWLTYTVYYRRFSWKSENHDSLFYFLCSRKDRTICYRDKEVTLNLS